jgi:hypothetical protein
MVLSEQVRHSRPYRLIPRITGQYSNHAISRSCSHAGYFFHPKSLPKLPPDLSKSHTCRISYSIPTDEPKVTSVDVEEEAYVAAG